MNDYDPSKLYFIIAISICRGQHKKTRILRLAGLNKQVHSYATRYANDFHLPFCRTNLRKFSVSFQGPTYYNSLENDIKESNSLHSFKTKLKKKIMWIICLKIL